MKITDLYETPIDMTGDPNDPVIHSHQKANPAHLTYRIGQARKQLQDLARLSESDDLVVWEKICRLAEGGIFMGLDQNLEQIRHGINELVNLRKKGGIKSRGINKDIGEHIVKVNGGYELKSKHGNKNLGKYPTKAGAEKRERQVQYFKHAGKE